MQMQRKVTDIVTRLVSLNKSGVALLHFDVEQHEVVVFSPFCSTTISTHVSVQPADVTVSVEFSKSSTCKTQ